MALPQHKTCLSILRSILGPGAGGEARFAEKIGRSTSWLKKASCGQIPLMRDAAILIAYETGVSLQWLVANDTTKPPLDRLGNPFTLESYAAHRVRDREEVDEIDALESSQETIGCLHEILRIYWAARSKNRAGLFAFYLEAFTNDMGDKFGKADIYKKKWAASMAENLAHAVMEFDAAKAPVVQVKSSKPTPQKKQPSRKSKRPGGH